MMSFVLNLSNQKTIHTSTGKTCTFCGELVELNIFMIVRQLRKCYHHGGLNHVLITVDSFSSFVSYILIKSMNKPQRFHFRVNFKISRRWKSNQNVENGRSISYSWSFGIFRFNTYIIYLFSSVWAWFCWPSWTNESYYSGQTQLCIKHIHYQIKMIMVICFIWRYNETKYSTSSTFGSANSIYLWYGQHYNFQCSLFYPLVA